MHPEPADAGGASRHVTKQLKIGCAFNITPMWHPLRLAEDFATADILTNGRTIFGVGRGYHTREVETFGAPMLDQNANRELFEEQVEIMFKAFDEGVASRTRANTTRCHPRCRIAAIQLKELTLVPRPIHLPVECWQPIVSANPRGLDFMVKHGIKGAVGGGAATMEHGPITALSGGCGARRQGLEARREPDARDHHPPRQDQGAGVAGDRPLYEEHVKMFAPLGFVPGMTRSRSPRSRRRGGWAEAGVPKVDHYIETRRLVRRHAGRAGRAPEGP